MTILARPNNSLNISLGGILGGIAGGITGFIGGGPAGAVAGAVAGARLGGGRPRGGGVVVPQGFAPAPVGGPVLAGGPLGSPCCPPGTVCQGTCISTPIGAVCTGGCTTTQFGGVPVAVGGAPSGAPVTTGVVQGQAVCPGDCVTPGGQRGRLKCDVVGGQVVQRCVAKRRRNLGNMRANRNALNRTKAAHREFEKFEKAFQAAAPKRRAPRRRAPAACPC